MEIMQYIYLILFVIKLTLCDKEIVETTHGKVSGKVLNTLLKGHKYYGYMGIPYAAPPIKGLRFLPPQPVDPWPEVLEATKEKQACIQYNNNVKKGQSLGHYGSEDCLYLDIFTPRPDHNRRPVIIFLFNEYLRYSYNKTKDYAPDFFIEEDVVIATISHRLALFGFLSFEDHTLQGNAGLKDIVAGLRWITDNIERFGGDPNRITLMGSQGGAVAVDLLIHSEARKLFHSAILQGGTAWSSMYLQDDARQRALKLAELFDLGPGNTEKLLKELNEIPAKDLLRKELNVVPQDYNKEHQRSLLAFGPTVEQEGLVTRYPESSENIDLPIMIGFNSREGLEKSLQYLIEHKYLSFVEKDFVLLMPWRVDFKIDPLDNKYEEAVKDVKWFYFKDGKVTIRNVPEYVTYIGDVFSSPIDYAARFYSNITTRPLYYYYFDYDSDLNENKIDLMKISETKDETWGAASGDELCYLFKCPRLKDKYISHNKTLSEDIITLRKMVRMWANYARVGDPTPDGDPLLDFKWPVYDTDTKEYLHIGRSMEVKQNPCEDRFQFWHDFVNKWKNEINNNKDERKQNDEL